MVTSMNNQKGFTLVELMVVMAIIAILSTMGLSQYGNFIKNARDTTRVADLSALNVVLLDSIQSDGVVPEDVDAFEKKIKEVAGKFIVDPLDGKVSCLKADSTTTVACHYQYGACDGGTGYILATSFESKSNTDKKYKKDDVSTSDDTGLSDDLYEIGNCNSLEDVNLENIWNTVAP
jgi:prepilin-type N-terminal cleavage/methylation domain-containing protein